MGYQNFFEEKLKELAGCKRILDVGGGHPFQKRMAPYKHLFEGKQFETLDNAKEYNPTILGDVHNIPLPDESIDGVLCVSVLEHLYDPKRAAEEVHRVLKPGGKLLLYTHFIYPYHARKGIYEDYFRYTEAGLRYLFRDFSTLEIKKQGGWFHAMMYFLPGQRLLVPILKSLALFLDSFFRTEHRTTTSGYYVFAVK